MANAFVAHQPADTVTGVATAAITGGRLVKVSAARAAGENIKVATAGATNVVFGVAGTDAASGDALPVLRTGIVDLTAASAVTAGQRVEVAADGQIAPLNTGVAIGVATDDIAQGASGPVALNI